MSDPQIKAPPPTMDDRKAAMLIVRLAAMDPDEAIARLVPLCTAARHWAEGQVGVKNEGSTDES